MAPAFRHSSLVRGCIATLLVLAMASGLIYYRSLVRLASSTTLSSGARPPVATATASDAGSVRAALTGDLWSVFRMAESSGPAPGAAAGPARFRLVGTFFVEAGSGVSRGRAVIEASGKRDQYVVGEGDAVEDATVEKIFQNHVILKVGSGSQELWQEFASVSSGTTGIVAGASNLVAGLAASGSTNKFGGIQVGERRWEFSRKPLLDYYQELLDEPDRMVAVFDSLKPVRDQARKITGYVIGMEGEKEFFAAAGLQNGDVVRKVNSLDMTSRRRAEYLIDEFLKNRMGAVVLDIERDGQPSKLIYQVRP